MITLIVSLLPLFLQTGEPPPPILDCWDDDVVPTAIPQPNPLPYPGPYPGPGQQRTLKIGTVCDLDGDGLGSEIVAGKYFIFFNDQAINIACSGFCELPVHLGDVLIIKKIQTEGWQMTGGPWIRTVRVDTSTNDTVIFSGRHFRPIVTAHREQINILLLHWKVNDDSDIQDPPGTVVYPLFSCDIRTRKILDDLGNLGPLFQESATYTIDIDDALQHWALPTGPWTQGGGWFRVTSQSLCVKSFPGVGNTYSFQLPAHDILVTSSAVYVPTIQNGG